MGILNSTGGAKPPFKKKNMKTIMNLQATPRTPKTHNIKEIKVRTITRKLVEQAPRINPVWDGPSGYPWETAQILGSLNDGYLLVKNGLKLERVSVTVYVLDHAVKYGWNAGGEAGAAAHKKAYEEGNHGFEQLFTV